MSLKDARLPSLKDKQDALLAPAKEEKVEAVVAKKPRAKKK